jgi:phage recombination protein Bet
MNAVKDFKPNELQLIQRTVARDCNDDEFRLFIHLCKAVRLDPLRRQCYAFVYGKDHRDKSKRQLTLVTSIQGYRTIADRTGNYRPDEHEAEYQFLRWKADRDNAIAGLRDIKDLRERKVQRDVIDELYPVDPLNPHGIEKAVVRVWKFAHGAWHQVVGEAYWEEHVPLKEGWDEREQRKSGTVLIDPKKTGWVKMPRLMIAKIAESQALRKGWPDDYSNISVEEETHREESRLDVLEAIKLAEENDRLRKIGVGKHRTISMDFGGRDPIDPVPIGALADRALAFIEANARDPQTLLDWQVRNRHGLNEFWAIEKSAALAIKKAVEKAVEKANSPPAEEAA